MVLATGQLWICLLHVPAASLAVDGIFLLSRRAPV